MSRYESCLELGRSCVDPDYRSRAVIDRIFNTVDVCFMLPTEAIKTRYLERYNRQPKAWRLPDGGPSMSTDASHLRAILRAAALILLTLFLLPPALVSRAASGRAAPSVTRLWHRAACRIVGLDLRISGQIHAAGPTLFAANHISYLDILLFGSRLCAGFIAKSEVRGWPAIGALAELVGTVFVERRVRDSARQRDALRARFEAGDGLVLFAEDPSSE